ncbi:MAG: hypothetical protein HYX54_08995 [Chloroflexi bacterium]|nr:hypothetical protein [Chloroflexota bacterium]
MPFGFGRRKDVAVAAPQPLPAADATTPRSVRFHGFTEDWRLDGAMALSGRLLDTLNHRDAIPITDVRWAPLDGSAELEPAPGIQSMDPYDLIVVLAGADTLVPRTDEERAAHRIHKITFDVALDAPPFRVIGTVRVHPGAVPESLLERGSQMFVAVTDPVLQVGDAVLDLGGAEAVLVNRFYLRDVTQVDKSTGLEHVALPGTSQGHDT